MKIRASVIVLAGIGSLTLATPALSQIATRHLKNPGLPAIEPHGGLKADPWLAELGQPELIVPDEFFVEFDPAATAALAVLEDAGREDLGRVGIDSLDETCTRHGVARIRRIAPGVATPELRAKIADGALRDPAGMAVVTVDLERTTLEAAMADFAADPFVMKVEPIGIHRFTAPPNDPLYASQWQFNQTSDRDIDLPEGLDIQNGAPSRIVAVLDTGVRYFHRDLGGSAASLANPTAAEGNMWINTAEKLGVAGADDDGNGFIDDWIGYDFVHMTDPGCWPGEDCTGTDNDPRDFNGHGTHCAGLVAAINNNGYGASSVAGGFRPGTQSTTGDGARVMALRIGYSATDIDGTEAGFVRMDFVASALYYAADNGARIASCSFGSSNSGGIAAAVDYFLAAGGIMLVSAGNANTETPSYLPSRDDVFSVAATTSTDAKASISSYGTWVDISAPGQNIPSLFHDSRIPASDATRTMSGTSMACPIVAGVVANVWSMNPTWTAAQVWHRVRTTADEIDSLNPTHAGKLGVGRVNLHRALTNAANPQWSTPTTAGKLLLCFSSNAFTGTPMIGAAGFVPPEDIAQYDGATRSWSRYFDGSDVGLAGRTIDAMAVTSTGDILLSFNEAITIPGLTGGPNGLWVGAEDIVRFRPVGLGENTAGTFAFYFDGSDADLTTPDENVDAIAILPSGAIGISTTGTPAIAALPFTADEDILAFTPSQLGATTVGTWSWGLDLSDVGYTLTNEDTDAAWVSSSGQWTFSMLGDWSVPGASGDGNALINFAPAATGISTAGSSTILFNGAQLLIPSNAAISAVHRLP